MAKKAVVVPAKKKIITPAENATEFKNPLAAFYAKGIKDVEKKTGIYNNTVSYASRLSTDILCYDWICGGGLLPGLSIISGEEGTGKTTTAYHAQAVSIFDSMPLTIFWDAEGTVSPKYASNIWRSMGLDLKSMTDQPESGYRYYRENVIEKFFDFLILQLNRMPAKQWNPDINSWTYLIPKRDSYFAELMEVLSLKADRKLTNDKYYVCPTENDRPEGMVVVDSFAAMITDDMEEEEKRGGQRAQEASAFSMHLKRAMAKIQSRQFIMQGTNQLRKIPGKVYGGPDDQCFTGNTPVVLEDGSTKTIRDIVRKKLPVKVLSFNPETGEISSKRVTNWFDNGNALASKFIKIGYYSYDSLGRVQTRYITCTKNHKIWTIDGWKRAGDLTKDSNIYTYAEEDTFNEDQTALIVGSLLGDAQFTHGGESFFRITWQHSTFQRPYLLWKLSIFGIDALSSIGGTKGRISYRNNAGNANYKASSAGYFNREIGELIDTVYDNSKKTTYRKKSNCQMLIDKLNIKSLAVWYLDDGTPGKMAGSGRRIRLSCSRFSQQERKALANKIAKLVGIDRNYIRTNKNIEIFGKANTDRFHAMIAPYVPPCMSYKLFDPSLAGGYTWQKGLPSRDFVMLETDIASIEAADEKSKYVRKYDIEVEDNHTYFVGTPSMKKRGDFSGLNLKSRQEVAAYKKEVRMLLSGGLAVSNSYEPGGEALKFYSQCRARTYTRKVMDGFDRDPNNGKICMESSVDGGKDRYSFKEFKNTKNKTNTPLLRSHARVWTSDRDGKGRGFDPVFDTYQHLVNTKQLEESKGKMRFVLKDTAGKVASMLNAAKPFDWDTFKRLILSEVDDRKDLLKQAATSLDINKNPMLRSKLFDQMKKDSTLYQSHEEIKAKKAVDHEAEEL